MLFVSIHSVLLNTLKRIYKGDCHHVAVVGGECSVTIGAGISDIRKGYLVCTVIRYKTH